MNRRSAVLLVALCAASSGAAQAPLSVDTAFRVDLPAQNVFSVLPLPDGKILISGNLEFEEFPSPPRSGERLLPNGQRDFSFNQGFLPMGAKITPWSDRYYCGNGDGIRRFLYSGAIDTDFDFINQWQQISPLQGGDYHVFPDGRVLFGGFHDIDDPDHGFYQGVGYNLAWITAEGRLDTTRIHRTGNGSVFGIKEYPAGTAGGLGGKFLVHHWGTEYEGVPVSKVIRVHADGSLDESFNAPVEWGFVMDMLPLPDGRAYLSGTFRLENASDTIQLIRVLPNGTLDPAFNNTVDMRKDTAAIGVDASIQCMLEIGPGLLAITGGFNEVDGRTRGGICILDTLGNVVDNYLAGAGCDAYDYPIGMTVFRYASIAGITQAPDGDYYIWGAYHGYTDGTTNDTLQRMVTRLHGGEIGLGISQPQAQVQPMMVYPNPATNAITVELERVPGAATLVVRDALGRKAMVQRVNGYTNTLSLHGLGEGVYILELLEQGERIGTQQLVVQQ